MNMFGIRKVCDIINTLFYKYIDKILSDNTLKGIIKTDKMTVDHVF